MFTNRLPVTTIDDYEAIKNYAFQNIMNLKLKELDEDILQEAVNIESERFTQHYKKNPRPISPKRLQNEYGLLKVSLKRYRKDLDYSSVTLSKSPRKKRAKEQKTQAPRLYQRTNSKCRWRHYRSNDWKRDLLKVGSNA